MTTPIIFGRFEAKQFVDAKGNKLFGVWDRENLRFVSDDKNLTIGFTLLKHAIIMSNVINRRNQ